MHIARLIRLHHLLRLLLLDFIELILRAMACPIELEAALSTRDVGVVEAHVDIFRNLVIWKFDETIANRSIFNFVSYKFNLSNTCNSLK